MSLPVTDSALQLQLVAPLLAAQNTWASEQSFAANDFAISVSNPSTWTLGLLTSDGTTVYYNSNDLAGLWGGTGGNVQLAQNAIADQSGNNIEGTYAGQGGTYGGMSVGFASNAGSAGTAGTASSADFATNASMAVADQFGNTIDTTYAALSGCSFSGTIVCFGGVNTSTINNFAGSINNVGTIQDGSGVVIDVANLKLVASDNTTTVLNWSTQAAAIANATNAVDVITQLNLLLAACRTYGLIAT